MFFGDGQHLVLEFGRAKVGMDMQDRFAARYWVQHGRELSIRRFPEKNHSGEIPAAEIGNQVPAPVVKLGDVPAQLAQAVAQQHLAQKGANSPVVVFTLI